MTLEEQKVNCILCDNSHVLELESIKTSAIILWYKKKLKIDTTPYFNSYKKISYFLCPQCDLRFFAPIVTGSDKFYESLQKFNWYYQKHKSEYTFCANFTDSKNILEIGCGGGYFFDHSNAASFKGLEFNQQAIDICNRKGLDVEKNTISDFSKLHACEYDVVCSFQVLEHVEYPIKFIQDAVSCLKKQGHLLLSVPSEDSFLAFARNNVLNMPPHHVSRWSDSNFRYVAERLNIELLDIQHDALEPIHYKWYCAVMGQQKIRVWLNQPSQKLFDETIRSTVATKLGSLLGTFLKKSIIQKTALPIGHTVTAVFKKP